MRVVLLTLCVALLAADGAAAGCGDNRLPPRGARIGVAPLAVGDSVMMGASRPLARAGIEVDARCARSPRGGIEVLRKRKSRGTLPEIVIFGLGTNVWVTRGDIRKALRILGRRRTLLLVTPVRSWRAFGNASMRRAARRWPGRIALVDWAAQALRNRHWLGGDGTHLTRSGALAYRRILKRAAWSRQRGRFGNRRARTKRGGRSYSSSARRQVRR